MYCYKCGKSITTDGKFCGSCGVEVKNNTEKMVVGWSRKKGIFWVMLSIVLTSVVWFFILASYSVSLEDSVTNVLASTLETIGRQSEAWTSAESITELYSYGLSDECLLVDDCVDEVLQTITTVNANIDSQRKEIDNLWSTGTVMEDFDSFYSSASETNQAILDKVLNQYFPEEAEEVESSVDLL